MYHSLTLLRIPLEGTTPHNVPSVVKLRCIEGPRVTRSGTIEKPSDGGRGYVYRAPSDQCGTSESGCIRSIELPHNLLTIRPRFSSHPITLVKIEQPVNVWNRVQAPGENFPLFCDQSGHFLFVVYHLSIPVYLPLALDTPPILLAGYWSGNIILGHGYGLRTSILVR
ncbi:hypothetical protein H5410_006048 [Solanum commersonii]|uniref:Uncharacterized protein n=1 Tax=Solanum commersonii TaxID=4109 RepID=A0A9J6A832_SOLCO|nr:hypothetical protein H5410_006048 [Solanum commersonii]